MKDRTPRLLHVHPALARTYGKGSPTRGEGGRQTSHSVEVFAPKSFAVPGARRELWPSSPTTRLGARRSCRRRPSVVVIRVTAFDPPARGTVVLRGSCACSEDPAPRGGRLSSWAQAAQHRVAPWDPRGPAPGSRTSAQSTGRVAGGGGGRGCATATHPGSAGAAHRLHIVIPAAAPCRTSAITCPFRDLCLKGWAAGLRGPGTAFVMKAGAASAAAADPMGAESSPGGR